MKNLNQLGFILGLGTLSVLSFSLGACSDDPEPGGGTAGTGTAGTGTSGSGTGGTGTAGTGTGGSSSGSAGKSTGGSGGSTAGSGGSGGATGGSGGASGGSGGASGGGGAGGGGGGGGAGPMCPDIEGPMTDSATCMTYCADAVGTCGSESSTMMKIKDAQTCATFCATFTQTQLCCRAYHVKMAGADKATHCPHSVGMGACQ